MSLAAIQDNLLKTSLVQQTQSRSDDIGRGQEIANQATTREQARQADQVVIHTQQKEGGGITDEERERRRREEEEEEREYAEEEETEEEDNGPRARMRTINIVI